MKNKKIKVLCFTDGGTGRDVEMMLPIRYFAERFLDCEFEHALNIDFYQIYKTKPDIILTPNTMGSNFYFTISKLAYEQCIPIFSLFSEGNFRTDGSFNYWGFNKDKKFYQEYICCWSERTLSFLKKEVPEAADKIVLTGGVGFDRYSIYKFAGKEDLLKKYNLESYKKVIGYAGWAFGKLEHKRGVEELLYFFNYDKSKLEWLEEQRKKVRDILKESIKNNPDILFILKKHPQENAPERVEEVTNEMSELAHYKNVLYLGEEEAVHDLISACDFWTCFESTTSLEAWLMGKETLYINPEPDFNRDPLYTGALLVKTYNEFQKLIDEFYNNRTFEEFNSSSKVDIRNNLIKEIIGFGDGMNHIRASYYFQKTLQNKNKQTRRFKFYLWHFIVHVLIIIGSIFYVRFIYKHLYKFKKHLWVFENYKLKELHKLYEKYSIYLDDFYTKNGIENKFKTNKLFEMVLKS